MSQMLFTLTHGEKTCQAVVLVQTGASLELLLGTDVLAQLDFYLLEVPHVGGHMTELLKGDIWQEAENTSSISALRADASVFVPVLPSTRTTESPEAQLQQTVGVIQNGVLPAQPSILEDKPEETGKDANEPEIRVKDINIPV